MLMKGVYGPTHALDARPPSAQDEEVEVVKAIVTVSNTDFKIENCIHNTTSWLGLGLHQYVICPTYVTGNLINLTKYMDT